MDQNTQQKIEGNMIEIKQHRLTTPYSWALFRNGQVIISGLTLEQAIREKEKICRENAIIET